MMSDGEINKLRRLLETKPEGGFFRRRKIKKKMKQVDKQLLELELITLEKHKTNIEEDIKSTEKAIRLSNVNIIKNTAQQESEPDILKSI